MSNSLPATEQKILELHQLYCQLTGQSLSLGFGRQRMWFELLRLGYQSEHVVRVIRYLQREIREGRRNVGALKLSNLLRPDHFEEDLNIRRVQLYPQSSKPKPAAPACSSAHPLSEEQGRQRALDCLQKLKAQLRSPSANAPEKFEKASTAQSQKCPRFNTD